MGRKEHGHMRWSGRSSVSARRLMQRIAQAAGTCRPASSSMCPSVFQDVTGGCICGSQMAEGGHMTGVLRTSRRLLSALLSVLQVTHELGRLDAFFSNCFCCYGSCCLCCIPLLLLL